MKKSQPIHFFLLIWFFSNLALLFAQEGSTNKGSGDTEPQRRVCVFLSVNLSHSGEDVRYQELIADALEMEFRNAGFNIVPREDWQKARIELDLSNEEIVLGPNAMKVARRADSDFAVTGFFKLEGNRLLLEIKCYGVPQNRLVAGNLASGRSGLSVYNMINESVRKMIPEMKAAWEPLPALERLSDARLREITLLSEDEDAEVLINGEKSLGRVKNGAVTELVARDTDLIVEIRKEGFHSRKQVIRQLEGKNKYALKRLAKETRWASDILYTIGQNLGVGMGLRYYFLPDQFYAGLEDYFFLQHKFGSKSQPVVHDDIRFLLGNYLFFPPDSLFRIGVSTGFGLILTGMTVPDQPVFTDFYLNVFNGWIEVNLHTWSVFFRVEGKYGLNVGNNLLGGRWHLVNGSVPPLTLGAVKKW